MFSVYSLSLNERSNPTYGMILLASNPLSDESHYCCFIAGTRSIGTVGASWALATLLEKMKNESDKNYGSFVQTDENDVLAGVSVALCRVTKVSYSAWRNPSGEIEPGGTRIIPTDAPDPRYLDSYIPAEVEIFTNKNGVGKWEVICSGS